MKYDYDLDNREECIRSAAKLVEKISRLYDHDNKNETMYSEMYSRISWLLNALADNSNGKVDSRIEDLANDIQQIAGTHKESNVRK